MPLSEPGFLVSGVFHAGALVLLLSTFSCSPSIPESQEAVPVETVTDAQYQEVMRGEKDTKVVADAPPPADTVADKTDPKPTTKPVAKEDTSAPPPPPAPPDPAKDDTPPTPPDQAQSQPTPPTPPTPPPPVPEPPPRPEVAETPPPPVPLPPVQPPSPTPPPIPTPPQRVVPDAEAIAPMPPPKPAPPKLAEPKPIPKPPQKPRPEKPKLDQLAKLIDQTPPEAKPVVHKAVSHARPAEAQPNPSAFDPTDISRLLSKTAPTQTASTGRQVSHTRVAGSETGAAQKMAASLWDQLDGLLEDQYKQCWSYLGLDGPTKYIPQIKVLYAQDGGLIGEPVLINPPADPAMRNLADSAMRAVRRCNPLRIPSEYAPYYDQWKGRVLRFDPVDMAG